MNTSEVYMLTFPDGKVYIGRCNQRTRDNTEWGAKNRLDNHIRASRGTSTTRISDAIRKFGEDNIQVEVLLVTNTSNAKFYEDKYIELYNTINPEFGYNSQVAGNPLDRLPESTRQKMSESRLIYTPKPHSEETKKKISKTLIDNVIRTGHTGEMLPKYVKYEKRSCRHGYKILSHPSIKDKYFVTTQFKNMNADEYNDKMNEKYLECISHLARFEN